MSGERGDRFDRGDYEWRAPEAPTLSESTVRTLPQSPPIKATPTMDAPGGVVWPVERPRIGQSVMANRDGKGRPHLGLDLFVKAGSPVRAAVSGRVLRIKDGRQSKLNHRQRAGLWIDIAGSDGRIYRYLHLASASVQPNSTVSAGTMIGTVADRHTSGSGQAPHLHFEIRGRDWNGGSNGSYGEALDPLPILQAGGTHGR